MSLTNVLIDSVGSSLVVSMPVASPTTPRLAQGNTTLMLVGVTPRSLAVRGPEALDPDVVVVPPVVVEVPPAVVVVAPACPPDTPSVVVALAPSGPEPSGP